MRVLLSDGSGLTARQVASELAAAGHQVGVLSPSRFVLTRFTRTVEAVHHVPPYGEDPWHWLDSALRVAQRHGYRVLFPTQEQLPSSPAPPNDSSRPASPPRCPRSTHFARSRIKPQRPSHCAKPDYRPLSRW
jgi:hypothetical protein